MPSKDPLNTSFIVPNWYRKGRAFHRDDASHRGFGQIAFLPNLSENGYILIIAGTSMDGTQAATEFLFDPRRSNPILELAEKKSRPFGGFEVLLQAQVLDHGTVGSTILGTRYYPLSATPLPSEK